MPCSTSTRTADESCFSVVLVLFTDSLAKEQLSHDSLSKYQWSKINLIKPQRKMNQMNVKFNIKRFAALIEQLEQQCYVVDAVPLIKERGICVRPYCIKGGVSSRLASSFST